MRSRETPFSRQAFTTMRSKGWEHFNKHFAHVGNSLKETLFKCKNWQQTWRNKNHGNSSRKIRFIIYVYNTVCVENKQYLLWWSRLQFYCTEQNSQKFDKSPSRGPKSYQTTIKARWQLTLSDFSSLFIQNLKLFDKLLQFRKSAFAFDICPYMLGHVSAWDTVANDTCTFALSRVQQNG